MPAADRELASFDMRRFAPPATVTVNFRDGQSFVFPGDPDVDDVAVMLRLESEINESAGAELGERLVEAKQLVQRLIVEADPAQDPSGLKLGAEELLVVFALLVHGSTVAEAVGAAITRANMAAGEETEEERERRELAEGDDLESGAPLASPRRSRGASSSSDAAEDGSLATGTA